MAANMAANMAVRSMWTEPFSLLNHIVHKLVTSFRGLYGTGWDIMDQHVEDMRVYSKHSLLDCLWKSSKIQTVLRLHQNLQDMLKSAT